MKIKIGSEVMGIMGINGGYVGKVTSISGKNVTFKDSSGILRETLLFNLTLNVPPPGKFPRKD